MVSMWLTSLAWGIPFVLMLYGCAPSFPSNLREEIPIGKTKEEVDKFFARQNNDTGRWTSKTVNMYSKDGELETVHLYEWVSAPGYSGSGKVLRYETTFRNNELISSTARARDLRKEWQQGPYLDSEDILRRKIGCDGSRVSCD